MTFYDKNGAEITIGDSIIPDEGRELLIVSEAYLDEFGANVLFGQQMKDDPCAFSILTQENLSSQWTKVTDAT